MDLISAAYQRRAQLAQGSIRLAFAIYLLVQCIVNPPVFHFVPSLLLISLFAAWSVAILVAYAMGWVKDSVTWFPIIVDLILLTSILGVTSTFLNIWGTPQHAFILVVILAAFQFRPGVTMIATLLAIAAFATGLGLADTEPTSYWRIALFRSLFILVVGTACALLSWIQQAKMRRIGQLAADRSALAARVLSAEDRERAALAEALHDGALQNVLAARQDVDEVQNSPHAAEMLTHTRRALDDAVRELRASVSTLHPAVLDNAGLGPALRTLVEESAGRGGFAAVCDFRIENAGTANYLMYRTARELLVNVVKHANASNVSVRLWATAGSVHLEITDDGAGVSEESVRRKAAQGHIGLASHRIRVEEAGGILDIRPADPRGTAASVSLPYQEQ
ncbi:sensor histidine kinase [Streptomyces sp. NPDC001774]